MPYNVYTYENVNMGACPIQPALDVLKQENKQQFVDNLEKWNCILGSGMENQMFYLIKDSSTYCKLDCEVPINGYCVFRDGMLEHTELDVDSYITVQPLASSLMLKSGGYEHVFQTSGVLQQLISRCVVGGRAMTNPNKMHHVKKKTADFDACSLYPSAMIFMKGLLKGLPQVLNNASYEFFKTQDGYFIRVETIKLSKHSDFPPTPEANEDGARDFINDTENGILHIDKIGLEDLITFMKLNLRLLMVIILIVVVIIQLIM